MLEYISEHQIIIPASTLSDTASIAELSKAKRLNYEKAQPQFWKYRGEDGEIFQKKWFEELLTHESYLMLTADSEHEHILGFIIGKLITAPEVYDPGGLTLMIDDFCVRSEDLWSTVGAQLIEHIKLLAKVKGATQILVVCGSHDYQKRTFLMHQKLSIASEWFVGGWMTLKLFLQNFSFSSCAIRSLFRAVFGCKLSIYNLLCCG